MLMVNLRASCRISVPPVACNPRDLRESRCEAYRGIEYPPEFIDHFALRISSFLMILRGMANAFLDLIWGLRQISAFFIGNYSGSCAVRAGIPSVCV